MKYKVLKGTDLFDKLQAIRRQISSAQKKIREYVKSIGAEDFATNTTYHMVKLDAVQFAEKPEGWKRVGESYQRLNMPKADNKKVWEAIRQLPSLEFNELNELVGYDQFVGKNMLISHRPGVNFGEELVLIEVAEEMDWYKPVPDMIEIPVSEFNKEKEIIQNRKEE